MLKLSYKNLLLLLYSIPASLLNIGLLFIINGIISGTSFISGAYLWLVFFAMVICSFAANVLFQRKVIVYANQLIYENEMRLFRAIRQTTLSQLENFGTERVYSTVEDMRVFVFLPGIITGTFHSLLMVVLCLVYLTTISPLSALMTFLFIAGLITAYFLLNRHVSHKATRLRRMNDQYYRFLDDALKGFKELKVSSTRSFNLFEKFFKPNRGNVKGLEVKISNTYLAINSISQYGLYIVLGLVIFLLPALNILQKDDVIPYVVTLFFIAAPVSSILSMQSFYTRAYVANKRISKFYKDFESAELPDDRQEYSSSFDKLELQQISYAYKSDAEKNSFSLDAVNFTVQKGEVVFIVGGNGSGKTTLINILTGLYRPDGGSIQVNGQSIENDTSAYRSLFSSIYTDNYLFTHNYEDYSLANNPDYNRLLKIMRLSHVVQDDSEDAARRKFSKGQSKRMAMVFALLEKHPILVLDEWAADQDPQFRRYFYETLLPQLKNEGKTIIAVSHDDAYYSKADRIVKLEYGKIVRDMKVADADINKLMGVDI